MLFLYDADGSVIGMQYRNSAKPAGEWDTYYYEKNLQGDIVAIYNASGTKLVSYNYDAWGDFTRTDLASNVPDVVKNNPITYRGYYYDDDLDLYYLATRYYDPFTCRFVTADSYVSTGQGILGYNRYAYCGNNPVNRIDPAGESWLLVIALIASALLLSGCSNTTEQSPRQDLAAAPDLDISQANYLDYNCYGNAIGKQIVTSPTGYKKGDSTRKTFDAVKKDLGEENVRELNSINDPIFDDEYRVALKCGPRDYHFIRQINTIEWYNKSGTKPGVMVSADLVSANVWYARYENCGLLITDRTFYYYDETIYFAVKKGWSK